MGEVVMQKQLDISYNKIDLSWITDWSVNS